MSNIVAVCAMYHLDEMNKMLKIATSQAEDLGCLLYTSPSPRDG